MRGFRDRDFLQTSEGFIFCVVGSLHPPNRVISYIKYVPSKSGIWRNGEKKFSRILPKYTIPNLLETFNFLEQNHPHYLFHSPINNITITAVPHERITKHFKPEKKLLQLRQELKLDSLQTKLMRFTKLLEKISGVSEASFGVTGSLLLNIHQPKFSDLDVIVYGTKDSWALKEALTEKSSGIPMKRLKGNNLKDWCIKKSHNYPLTPKEFLKLYERKWNLGYFEDKWVSIHPVKLENEVTEEYGKKMYIPHGQVTMEAVVRGNVDSIFLPATYQIEDVKFLDNQHLGDNVTEVVSYEGIYDSLAENGEKVQVKGKLERVRERGTRRQHYRVLVGSTEGKGREYMKLSE